MAALLLAQLLTLELCQHLGAPLLQQTALERTWAF
jgi:hypothetical protein